MPCPREEYRDRVQEIFHVQESYEPRNFALDIFKKRYALHPGETWEEACDRVASHVATAERGQDVPTWRQTFSEELRANRFMPGGRIWYGSGRPKGQLQNCFVVPTDDSREGWGETAKNTIVISGTGGGVGVNFSSIRPRGSTISGSGGVATGATSLMQILNAAGDVIKAGGGRRVALMFCLRLTHPDLPEFLGKKLDRGELTNANVSVVFDENPETFFAQVREDRDLELTFRGRVVSRVPAREIWNRILDNALKNGEPGILNGYLANKLSTIAYYKELVSTNPCGEVFLSAYESCCLGSLVLPRFLSGKEIEWDALARTVRTAVRFLDDVLTVNAYPIPEIASTCQNLRRIGLGVTGLHDLLLRCGLRYNSDGGLELVDKVLAYVKNTAYEASTELAVEKGAFPRFDAEKFLKSGFVKTLRPSLRSLIRERGIRNCALLTIAPTGTTSLVCDVSSGVEPMFAPAYLRRYQDGDETKEEVVVHPLFREFVTAGRSVKHFQGAHDLKVSDHLEMQRTCQRHLDNACSKTVNLPPGTSREDLSELLMEYLPELKGLTVYPEGSRENQPLTPIPLADAIEYAKRETASAATSRDSCRGGSCDL